MKGNSISLKPLNESAKIWLEKTLQVLKVQKYGKGSVRYYMQELTLLYCPEALSKSGIAAFSVRLVWLRKCNF